MMRQALRSTLPLLALLSACVSASKPGPLELDVLLRGGTVYDGSGAPPYRADVGIRGDEIALVGDLSGLRARETVDVSGLALAPGFINVLSWSTESLLEDPRGLSDLVQGVTLQVFGEGTSMGPLTPSMRERLLSEQTDIRFEVPWTTLGEYLEHLERRGVVPNVASFVGATTVRIHELGYTDRAPTDAELERMGNLVAQAMREGALGVGSALIYAPGLSASTEELIALARVAAAYGGRYITHMRSEGNRLEEALEEVLRIARESGAGAEIYHLKAAGEENWRKLDSVLERIDTVRGDGLDVSANIYLYTAAATGLDAAMPPWVQAGGREAWIERLRDPATRARVAEEMRTPSDEWENLLLAAGDAERVRLVEFASEDLAPRTGQTLAQAARELELAPEEAAIDLVVRDGTRVGAVYFLMSEANVRKKLARPWVALGSDASSRAPEGVFLRSSSHPRAYGNFARLFSRYVREEGLLSVEEAVRRVTSLPARNLGLARRGRLVPGAFADVVAFDPALMQDHSSFDDPHQLSTGVRHVFINGVAALRAGRATVARPGRFVRGPGYDPRPGPAKSPAAQ